MKKPNGKMSVRNSGKRYVSTSLVVISLLTLIMMGGRLIKYFGVAAQGRLDASVLIDDGLHHYHLIQPFHGQHINDQTPTLNQ
jgi:hypothetical protein